MKNIDCRIFKAQYMCNYTCIDCILGRNIARLFSKEYYFSKSYFQELKVETFNSPSFTWKVTVPSWAVLKTLLPIL